MITKKIQELKVTHFLRIVKFSLTKHFGIWVSADLIFLSLFSNQKIGTYIDKFIMGISENISKNCVSSMHDQIITIPKLKTFLNTNMLQKNITTVRNSPFM